LKNEEFTKLKNTIAIKVTGKIMLYTLFAIFILLFLVDVIYNDYLADSMFNMNSNIYYWCVANKTILMGLTYLILFAVISFIVIRNSNNNMVEIISAMDQILKEPGKEVNLSNQLMILESKLNNIRIDLITSQNEAKEANAEKDDLIMYMAHDLKNATYINYRIFDPTY